MNEITFPGYTDCLNSLWHKHLVNTNIKNIKKNAK